MLVNRLGLVVAMSLSSGVWAGDFTNVPTRNTPGPATLVAGIQNPNADRLYIEAAFDGQTSAELITYLDPGTYGNFVPSLITYNAKSTTRPYPVVGTGTLSLLDFQVTRNIGLPVVDAGGDETGEFDLIGDLYDFVFRDSRDNSLVFGTRVVLGVSDEQLENVGNSELNFLYRYGFTGFSAAAAWMFLDNDLRLYEVGRTASFSYSSQAYDEDVIRMKSDISVSEGNPFSGLFLVKTDAQYYTLSDRGVGYYQAGEEGQAIVGNALSGFVPTNTPPVPEPTEYAMFLAGLGLVAAAARRRLRR